MKAAIENGSAAATTTKRPGPDTVAPPPPSQLPPLFPFPSTSSSPGPAAKPLAPVSRVITKESLRSLQQPSGGAGGWGSGDSEQPSPSEEEYENAEAFFGFSLFDSDADPDDSGLLSLPIVELPLTPPPLPDDLAATGSFDAPTAVTTESSSVSSSYDGGSSLLSTAAAIAATRPTTELAPASAALAVRAPPLVPLALVSPRPKAVGVGAVHKLTQPRGRPRSNSKAKASKKKVAPSPAPRAAVLKPKKQAQVPPLFLGAARPPPPPGRPLAPRSSIAQRLMTGQAARPAPAAAAHGAAPPRPTVPRPVQATNAAVTAAAFAAPRPAAVPSQAPATAPQPPRSYVPPRGAGAAVPGAASAAAAPQTAPRILAPQGGAAGAAAAYHPSQAVPRPTTAAPRARAPPPAAAVHAAHQPHPAPPAPAQASQPQGHVAENTGRWTAEEHRLFLQGLEQHGKGWKKIATLIKSRTVVQIRTHAQKYFQKLAKARQNGEAVGMVGAGAAIGHHPDGRHHGPEGPGIPVPLGADGQPVVTMRTANPHAGVVDPRRLRATSAQGGNMSLGTDPTSLAAAAGGMSSAAAKGPGGGRKRKAGAGGGARRKAIGNVVRSAVREGRNVKRQKTAEVKRKGRAGSDASAGSVALVPNPLPAVSAVLDPYVMTAAAGVPPPAPAPAPGGTQQPSTTIQGQAPQAKKKGRGRQQLVQTATHGTLPMAALEDAVFRLLTPATGAPAPPQPVAHHPPLPSPIPGAGGIVDPLAPHQGQGPPRVPVAHAQYHPSPPAGAAAPPPQGVPGASPTGVADMSLLPSWVDAKNPPQWYNDGGDIDALLQDAECLNWLSDTGDLDETYPPAAAEPAAVVSSSSTAVEATAVPEPASVAGSVVVNDPTGGVLHPSHESLSFLIMDPPEHQQQQQHHPVPAPVQATAPQPAYHQAHVAASASVPDPTAFASATEAVEAAAAVAPKVEAVEAPHPSAVPEHRLAGVGESEANLMAGFPDLDMGDEQAFVSSLLEEGGGKDTSVGGGLGHLSFPRLGSDLHVGGQSGATLSVKEEE